jgi:DNA repair exonuclease SbcCD nuclease subunit
MIFVSDLHLGDVHDTVMVDCPESLDYLHLFGKIASRTVETFLRLEEARDYAASTKQSIVIPGDIFDSARPDPRVVTQFISFLKTCDGTGVRVYGIPGNHDADATSFATYPLEAVFGATRWKHNGLDLADVDGVTVCFIPHLNEQTLVGYERLGFWEAAAKAVAVESKIIVTHGAVVSGGTPFIDEELSRANVIDPTHFEGKTIVAGHYHEPRDLRHGGTHTIIPGSVSITSFAYVDETLGFAEYSPKTDKVKWHPYKTVIASYKQFDIDAGNIKELASKDLSGMCEGAILKLVIDADSRGDVDEVAVRKMFGAAAKIAKFEVRTPEDVRREEKKITFKNLKPVELLTSYLKDQKKAGAAEEVVQTALTEGKKIIEKVVS